MRPAAAGRGARLPAIRDLALQCRVNPNTIVRVYAHLAEEGLFVIVIGIDREEGRVTGVDVISRGFVYADSAEDLLEEAKQLVLRVSDKTDLKELEDPTVYKNVIRREMKSFLYKETRRSPMILPIVTES